MRATHIDFKRPGCLRVTGAPKRTIFEKGKGWHETDVICVAPGTVEFDNLKRSGLPKWREPDPEGEAEQQLEGPQ